jgi:uncharacterized protein YjbI with pentapeptide repeats
LQENIRQYRQRMRAEMTNYIRLYWINRAPEEFRSIFEKHDMWLKGIKDGKKADLTGANLTGAYLVWTNFLEVKFAGANLTNVNLARANLTRCDFTEATIVGADLTGAILKNVNLAGANLSWANLAWADLTDSNLAGTIIVGAKLTEVDFTGCNLTGCDLKTANLEPIKTDFIQAILKLPAEIPNLREKFIEGKINGSTYEGQCACLAGTIANNLGIKTDKLEKKFNYPVDSESPRERFCLAVRPGDTPENNQIAALFVQWIDEALDNIGQTEEK